MPGFLNKIFTSSADRDYPIINPFTHASLLGFQLKAQIETLREQNHWGWKSKAMKLLIRSRLIDERLDKERLRAMGIEANIDFSVPARIQALLRENFEFQFVYDAVDLSEMAIKKQIDAFYRGCILRKGMIKLQKSGRADWEDEAVKRIRNARFECDPYSERMRLWGAGVFNKEIERRVEKAFWLGSDNFTWEKAILGQALEIQRIFEKTHYMFTHGQQREFYLISTIFKTMAKNNGIDMPHFKPMRPYPLSSSFNSIQKYSENRGMDDAEDRTKTELLSVSGNPYCRALGESANYYFSYNQNCSRPRQILSSFLDRSTAAKLSQIILQNDSSPGILNAILVPKKDWEDRVYPSHSFGRPCFCQPSDQKESVLQNAQRGHANLPCTPVHGSQYRMLLSKIEPKVCRIYALTPFSKEQRREIKRQVREILGSRTFIQSKL